MIRTILHMRVPPPFDRFPPRGDGFPFFIFENDQVDRTFHGHPWEELVIVVAGSATHQTRERNGFVQTYPIRSGHVLMIRPGIEHAYLACRGLRIFNVLHEPLEKWLPVEELALLPGYHALFRLGTAPRPGSAGYLRLRAPDLTVARSLIASLIAEESAGARGHRFVQRGLFMQLITLLARAYAGDARDLPASAHARLADLLGYLQANLAAKHSIRDLARRVGMSESLFARTFKRATGHSPADHLIRLRVRQAELLLRNTEASITEIALRCGFGDSNYFARQFRRVTGQTARDYRRTKGGTTSVSSASRQR